MMHKNGEIMSIVLWCYLQGNTISLLHMAMRQQFHKLMLKFAVRILLYLQLYNLRIRKGLWNWPEKDLARSFTLRTFPLCARRILFVEFHQNRKRFFLFFLRRRFSISFRPFSGRKIKIAKIVPLNFNLNGLIKNFK